LDEVLTINKRSSLTTATFSQDKSTVVCLLACKHMLAAGYADGTVRVWDKTGANTAFNAHKSKITALAFDTKASRLVSGSADTDIVLWDLVNEQGIARFRGHKDQITGLKFIAHDGLNHIISCSKDSLIKFWDIDSQTCVETVVSHRGEVWAIDVMISEKISFGNDCSDGLKCTLFSGAADGEIRVWEISTKALQSKLIISEVILKQPEIEKACVLQGSFNRQSKERILTLQIHSSGQYIGVQGSDKLIEIFKFKSQAEINKTINRRRKRAKKLNNNLIDNDEEFVLTMADKIPAFQTVRCSGKVKSFDFCPVGTDIKILAALSNNSLEFYDVEMDKEKTPRQVSVLELGGHRSDIRTLSLCSDDRLLMTGSSDLVKVWSVDTTSCLHTMTSGYALCSTFLPGNINVTLKVISMF
jgi:U3 small nucleolar RNA-associated protein 12